MAIEVGQLIVKSNVVQRVEKSDDASELDQEDIRKIVREECKALIAEVLREMKER